MNPSHPARPEGLEIEEVGVTEAARLPNAGLALLVDVRWDDEWAAEQAATALHVPLSDLAQTRLPSGKPVLANCQPGSRSATAAAALLAGGLDARNVQGGMQAWQTAGLASTTEDQQPAAGR